MDAKIFFGFILGFTWGVAIESLLEFGYPLALLFLFLGVVLLLSTNVSRTHSVSFLVSLILIACAAGVFRFDVWKMKQYAHELDMFLAHHVTLGGVVDREPDVREDYTNLTIQASHVLDENHRQDDIKTKILVRVPHYPEFSYGDRISFYGKLATPKNFASEENSKTFDYRAYLAKDAIFYQMYFPRIELVTQGQGNVIFQKLFAFKDWCLDRLKENLPEPESSLAGGILLGAKESLGEELLQKFRETGLAHIVVLSGYNIAIVVSAFTFALARLPYWTRIVGGVLGVVLFAMMVGGGATVVRATIMVLVVILARAFGRDGDALRALVLTGGVMVLMNPSILLSDVSFQLSFMATLALVVLSPLLEPYFKKIPSPLFREIVVSTVATQIFVLPLILYYMGSVSLVGIFANILVLPVMPLAMLCSALVIVVGGLPIFGSIAGVLAYGLLSYIILGAEWFASIPFSSLSGISFSLGGVVLFYALTFLCIFKMRQGGH